MKGTGKKVCEKAAAVLVAVTVMIAILLAGVRVTGLTPYAVLSGSMEPAYHVGALIYDKKVDPSELEVGDVITFMLGDGVTLATHRIAEIDHDGELFYTKGDANNVRDGDPVHADDIVGTPVFTIPLLGYVSVWIADPAGKIIFGAFAAVLLILLLMPDLFGKEREKKKEDV